MKRLISLVVSFMLVLSLLPQNVVFAETLATGVCGETAIWTLDSTGTLTISGEGAIEESYIVENIWEDGRLIEERRWDGYVSKIKNVVIEEGVTCIGGYVFASCSELNSVTIPISVIRIEDYSFNECSNIKRVYISDLAAWCSIDFDRGLNYLLYDGGAGSDLDWSNEANLYIDGQLATDIIIPDTVTNITGYAFAYCKSLTSITIPDSVVSVGESAFLGCINLKEIQIGNGVEEIGDDTFYGCQSLTNVEIPGNVKKIGNGAFGGCNKLNNLTICDGVEQIGEAAFFSNISLTETTIPKSVETICYAAFESCENLTKVTVLNKDTIIGAAFYYCDNLTIYGYPGGITEECAKQDEIPFVSIGDSGPDEGETVPVHPARKFTGEFEYYSRFTEESEPYDFSYDESWFFNDPYTYQHDLTKMSIRMAMAGAQHDASNIKKLYDKLGLSYTTESVNYPTPEYDSIGYAIGSRNISDEKGNEITLIAVTVRGGGYGAEWGGNFRLGMEYEHEGFNIAANTVCNAIKSYITSNIKNMKEDIKVWISGFSRAAATTNLVGKKLNDGFIKGISGKDVFAFCFECPQNTTRSGNTYDNKYSNIVNIVNPIDFVTKVAMSDWEYTRYGLTYYVPSLETSSKYLSLKNKMMNEYAKILESCGYSTIEAMTKAALSASEYYGQASTLDEFISNLSSAFINQTMYAQKHEQNMIEIAAKSFGSDKETEWGLNWISEIDDVFGMAILHPLNTSGTITMFATGPARAAHYPELCLAWIDALEGNYTEYNKYRKIFVNCPVNISVYDSQNNLVGEITNDVANEIENGIVAYVDDNGQKVVILPTDGEYNIQIDATADGTMTYTVSEFDGEANSIDKVVSYFNVEISDGETLVGNIENLENIDSAEYQLFKEGSEENIIPSIKQEGSEVDEFEVTVSSSGNGTAFGNGKYLNGEFAKVTAVPNSGAEFIGWYVENDVISTELEYRFLVNADIALTAKFTEKSTPSNSGGLSAGGDKSNTGADKFGNENKEDTTAPEETPVVTPSTPSGFTDLAGFAWAEDSITNLVEKGIIRGTSATTYSPANNIIRADFVALVVRMFNLTSAETENFADVNADDYFAAELAIARNNGIVGGIGDNKFAPRGNITRQDMMVMLYRAMQKLGVELNGTQVTDVSDMDTVSEYAKEAVETLMANGIINGKNGKIDPKANATRAEVAVMLNRVLDLVK